MKRILVCIAVLVALCSSAFAAKAAATKSATKINPKDGSVMITIPAGKFIMGSNNGEANEKPAHTVYLDTYQIGKYEVTVGQYRKFCVTTGRQMPKAPKWGWKDNHPVVNVTWFDAAAYCKWAGGRLPTEAEWEKAARGTDGRTYPWGNTWDKNKCVNYERALKQPLDSTARVGSYPAGASPYGCMDMAGNVKEWCADWLDDNYYKTSSSRNPKGPLSGRYRVLRGGSYTDVNSYSGCAYRSYSGYFPSIVAYDAGFRLARSSGAFAVKTVTLKSTSKSVTKAAATKINPKDGSGMVTIPAGKFIMGSDDGGADEKPTHTVYLDSYQIGKYEVTVAQYRKFCDATGREMPTTAPKWGWKDNHPVVNVTWFDAAAYCKWAGGRLPTEAEWEKAARGTNGRKYPWGNTWDKNKCANRELGLSSTAPVGSYPAGASPYGCMDMAGNAWEWCQDWFKSYPGNSNPVDDTNRCRVQRGSGWGDHYDVSYCGRCASRNCFDPSDYAWDGDYGFRLAR